MTPKDLDTRGLLCPQPVLKISMQVPEMRPGDLLRVVGDCPTFEEDVRKWVTRMKKTVLAVTRSGSEVTIQIQF
ncbi:MAG: sulfurtransferase TusA family protein [Candidatus Riflebacteria bacterium]|nr:sulfurtransferase TusA family protein [Candidatus Riflebacteria bacterium]